MTLKVEKEVFAGDPTALVLQPHGTLDPSTLAEFEVALAEADQKGMRRLLVDLSAATFLSSAAWALLIQVARKLRAAGGALVLCGMPDGIAEVHQDLDLSRFLPSAPGLPEAAQLLPPAR